MNFCEVDINKIVKNIKIVKTSNFDVTVFIKNKIREIEALQILNSKLKFRNRNKVIIKLYNFYYKNLNNYKTSLQSIISV